MSVLVALATLAAASPPEPEMSETPRARYEAWLRDRGATGEVRPGPRHGDSPYELFFVAGPAPGIKLHAAAASATDVVVADEPEGWGAYLRSADAAVLHAQIAWLHGAWVARKPSEPQVTEPKVEVVSDGGVTFEGIYSPPPGRPLFRFRVVVDPSGHAAFQTEALR